MIYLDNNASTKLDPRVEEAMAGAQAVFGNPSSVHGEGRRARRLVEEARDDVALLSGAASQDVFFTSGGTEANALAIFGGAAAAGPGARVVISGAEHPSVREAAEALAREGTEIIRVDPESSGVLDAAKVLDAAGSGPAFVSVMAANNEYGAIFPVPQIGVVLRERGILFHTDAVQAAGRIPVDAVAWHADLATISAHKMHGPKGTGALFIRRGLQVAARTPGGGQEKKVRAGTENTAAIAGFGVAARLARERLGEAVAIARLRDRLEEGILRRVEGTRAVGAVAPRLPNTSAILFEGMSAEALLIRLDLEGVAVSAGSACSSGTLAPSPAILSLGIPPAQAKSVIRFSLSRLTTAEEIEAVLGVVARVVSSAREKAGTD